MRSTQAVGRAQVEFDQLRIGCRLQARRPLAHGEVARQRHLRGIVGHAADRAADHQFAMHERQAAGDRVGGVEHLVQPRSRTAAHDRQGVGHAGGGDQVVGRGLQVGGAQHVGGLDEES